MYLLAYNLSRLAMLKAAETQRVAVNRISVVDSLPTRFIMNKG